MASFTPQSPPRRRIRPTGRAVAAAVGAVLLVVGVAVLWWATRPAAFDRPLAIDRALDASGGRLTQVQAACYVDRVRAKIGTRYLEPDVSIPAPVGQQLTAIRDDCVGLAGLGAPSRSRSLGPGPSTSVPLVPGTEAGNQPLRHGQDPALDALWTRCAAGDGTACDDLFARAPIGSEYERFALTCGGRTAQIACAAVYRTRPSTTSVTPTTHTTPTTR